MFCTSCGAQVAAPQGYCPQCGKALPAGRAVMAGARPLTWHLNLLSIFWYIIGGLWCVPALIMFLIGTGAGFAMRSPDFGPGGAFVGSVFFYCLGAVFALGAGIGLLTGFGLSKIRPWGRSLAMVMGVLSLVSVPLGTALGVYTLVVLGPAEAAHEYERLAAQAHVIMA